MTISNHRGVLLSLISLVMGLLAVATPGSSASTEVSVVAARAVPARLVVKGDGIRAVISTRPFRLSVVDGKGRTVVNQVENTRPAPFVGTTLEQPGGTDPIEDRALYSPFTFEVGLRATTQLPASPWIGVLIGAGGGGIQYSPRDVVSYRSIGRGGLQAERCRPTTPSVVSSWCGCLTHNGETCPSRCA